jgi:hypothetical protein
MTTGSWLRAALIVDGSGDSEREILR